MSDLLYNVKQLLNEWPEWFKSKRILLAVSGGIDSMVLLTIMLQINEQLPKEERKELIVAHFNHRLREDSDQDAQLVKEYSQKYKLTYFISHWDKPASVNVEASARDARYQFFGDVMVKTNSDTLMTAHHLNDLGETVLMRLIRGTSLRGVRGIRSNYQRILTTSTKFSKSVRVLRPFSSTKKEKINEYAKEHHIPFNEDQTNTDMTYMRNRMRYKMLPFFEEENPQFLSNLLLLSEQLEASYDAHFTQYLQKEPELLMQLSQGRWLLYVPKFLELSEDLMQVYLAIFLEERLIHQIQTYNKAAVKQLEQLIRQTDAPNMLINIANNWVALREYDYIWIQPQDYGVEVAKQNEIKIEQFNHWYKLSEKELAGVFDIDAIATDLKKNLYVEIPLSLAEGRPSITLRHRKNGDTLTLRRPDGTSYHKKVSRIMIDQKIPKSKREDYWVIENSEGTILGMLPPISKDKTYINLEEKQTHVFIYQKSENIS